MKKRYRALIDIRVDNGRFRARQILNKNSPELRRIMQNYEKSGPETGMPENAQNKKGQLITVQTLKS